MNAQLIEELVKLEQGMDAQWRLEKFKGVELQQKKVDGEEQVPCELDHVFQTNMLDMLEHTGRKKMVVG